MKNRKRSSMKHTVFFKALNKKSQFACKTGNVFGKKEISELPIDDTDRQNITCL